MKLDTIVRSKASSLTNICIAFGSTIKFSYTTNFEAIDKLWPNLRSKSVAKDDT